MAGPPPDELPVLSQPADGVPELINTPEGRLATLASLAAGSGPIAVDVERAQSYRYYSKAYLVQLRRPEAGTFLIDPIAFETPDSEVAHFAALREIMADQEWILHAASQDLPNLVQLGLRPTRIFDTELAGRLLGLPKVSLGAMTERYCGVRLLKEHSAVDWSRRPIPRDWLVYAALDVELLHELRDKLLVELQQAGKLDWARQEFEHLCRWALEPPTERPDRWRRVSGSHQVRSPRGLAVVKELWLARDEIAHRTNQAPGRVLPDAAISALGALVTKRHPAVPTAQEMGRIEGFKRRHARQHQSVWLDALDRVAAMTAAELPPLRLPNARIPMPRNWQRANPDAWQRWSKVRPAVVELAETLQLPVENLVAPDALRQLLWEPASPLSVQAIDEQLAGLGARPWQRELVAPLVVELLS